ncbi:hypothetical protein M011DRAFT_402771 [Sporormia fimetaria CBS 119925]|uniref:ORC6 first cyclin-like domain-containing protein n=1 Tax=Sporormia fimetaria CBS 119925 TaxID=1340428 RepID=A0A6A6VDM3_9PLEO|nr:hypothetical protein M011DRAFT_402771 [Sporormia fimetaria CBS 119925]
MSRATVEQALTGLLPTLNGPLPVELVELAMSLLSRSRSVAHSLKPDEEIARPYACSHLACERLKKRLNLPNIQSRPPCPPRIYKKLYNYLESALKPAGGREPETPRKRTATQVPASGRTTPKTPLSKRKTPGTAAKATNARELPEWVTPTVRQLVKDLSYPGAAPHVFAGVEATFPLLVQLSEPAAPETPSKRPRRTASTSVVAQSSSSSSSSSSESTDARGLALLAVITFYVLVKLMSKDIHAKQFAHWRDRAVACLSMAEAGKHLSAMDIISQIDQLMPIVKAEGWLNMDWFSNIVPEQLENQMEGVEATDDTAPDGDRGRGATLKEMLGSDYIGLGTMMQDATDCLGEQRCEDYKSWKRTVMQRIDQIESR